MSTDTGVILALVGSIVLLLLTGCDVEGMTQYGAVEFVCVSEMNDQLDRSGYPDTRITVEFNEYSVQIWEYYRQGDSVAFSSAGGGCEIARY